MATRSRKRIAQVRKPIVSQPSSMQQKPEEQPATQSDPILNLQRTVGNQRTIQMMRSQSSNKHIQRLAYNDDPSGWGDVALTRSGEGQKGVFFAKQGDAMVVVKPVDNPGNIAGGNSIMEAMGIEAPKMATYTMASTEGQALTALLLRNLGIGRTVKNDKGEDVDEIKVQLADSTHFVVMSAVSGKSIQRSDDGELHEYFTNASALERTGRMIVGDAYMGNNDRILTSGKPNLGNYFFQSNGFDGNIASIDNEAKFNISVNSVQTRMSTLSDLFDKKWRDNIINTFVVSTYGWMVRAGKTNAAAVIDPNGMTHNLVKSFIDMGITNGFKDLADLCRGKMKTVTDVGKMTGGYDLAKGIAMYIVARVDGTDHATAMDDFDSYIAYREKRAKMPNGLKWTAKLGKKLGF